VNFIGGRKIIGVWAQNLSAGRPRGVQRVAREVAENLVDTNDTAYLAITKISFEYGLVSVHCVPLISYLHAVPYQISDHERAARLSACKPIILPAPSIAAILSFECFESIWDWPLATLGLRVVGVVHDLIPFRIEENVEYENKNRYFKSLGNMIDRATYIVNVSKATENDLLAVFPCASEKSIVISNAFGKLTESRNRIAPTARKDMRRTITMIGTVEIRKNHVAVMRSIPRIAMAINDRLRFLIIGDNSGSADIFGSTFKYSLEHAQKFADIEFTGFIDDAAIQEHLSKTDLLVFPSLWEGFGMPILEALAYGIPVVASNTSSHVEVGGDVVSYCDPYDIDDISSTILSALSVSSDKKTELIDRGRKWTERFTWEQTAEYYNKLLQSVGNAGSRPSDLLSGEDAKPDQLSSMAVPRAVRLIARYGSPWKAWAHLGGRRLTVAQFNRYLNGGSLDGAVRENDDFSLASNFLESISSITRNGNLSENADEVSGVWSWSIASIAEEIIIFGFNGRWPARSITKDAISGGREEVVDRLGFSLLGQRNYSTLKMTMRDVPHQVARHIYQPEFLKLGSTYTHLRIPCPVSTFEIAGIQDLDECVSAAICKHDWADLHRGWLTNSTDQILRLQKIDSFDAVVPAGEIWSAFKIRVQDLDVNLREALSKSGVSLVIAGGVGFAPANEYYATGECEAMSPLFAASRYVLIPLRIDESLCEVFNNQALRGLSEGLITLAPSFFVHKFLLDHPELDTGWLIPYSDLSEACGYITASASQLDAAIDQRVQKARNFIGLTHDSRPIINDVHRLLSRAVHREVETDMNDASVFIRRAEDNYGADTLRDLQYIFKHGLLEDKSALILKTGHPVFSKISSGLLSDLQCLRHSS